jgi:hypothetical protein
LDYASNVGRATIAGGSVNDSSITRTSGPCGVVLDATYVYWANYGTGDIGRAVLDGTSVNQSFIAGGGGPVGLALTTAGGAFVGPSVNADGQIMQPAGLFSVPAGGSPQTVTVTLPVASGGKYSANWANAAATGAAQSVSMIPGGYPYS